MYNRQMNNRITDCWESVNEGEVIKLIVDSRRVQFVEWFYTVGFVIPHVHHMEKR